MASLDCFLTYLLGLEKLKRIKIKKRKVELNPYTFLCQGSPKPCKSPKLNELGRFKRFQVWATMTISTSHVLLHPFPPHFILLFVMNIIWVPSSSIMNFFCYNIVVIRFTHHPIIKPREKKGKKRYKEWGEKIEIQRGPL